jgi:energy-coupling factor transporter ATP-binding protein EcfA2
MFHACAVADPTTGDTVVLYGPSGTGKTTLARTLCTDLVYLTDETAGVDDQLRISPYPKPLSILVRPDDPVNEQASPGGLGLVRPSDLTYRLRALVQLRRDAEHRGAAVIEDLATIDALPELVAQTSYTREMERPLHRLADLAHQVGGVRRVTYAEAEQVRPLVRAILDGDA